MCHNVLHVSTFTVLPSLCVILCKKLTPFYFSNRSNHYIICLVYLVIAYNWMRS